MNDHDLFKEKLQSYLFEDVEELTPLEVAVNLMKALGSPGIVLLGGAESILVTYTLVTGENGETETHYHKPKQPHEIVLLARFSAEGNRRVYDGVEFVF